MCSLCNVSKSLLVDFSKSQRSKGANAKCKECIGAQQAPKQKNKNEEEDVKRAAAASDKRKANRKIHEENLQRAAANKAKREARDGETLKRQADNKDKRKKKEEERERKRLDAIAKQKKQEEERKLAAEIRKAEEKKRIDAEKRIIAAENEEKEALHYKQKKEAYDRYVQKLKDDGKDIDVEMSTPSDLVYVVTSISKGGGGLMGKFSPHLHGIYTTCKNAQECARKVFEKESTSYCGGKFSPNEERTAKCDTTEFLIPGVEFNEKVMFELSGRTIRAKYSYGDDKYVSDCTAIAIGVNAIPIDMTSAQNLPFLKMNSHEHNPDEERKKEDEDTLVGGTGVYAIFSHEPGDNGDGTEVNLCGIFRSKENAIRNGLEERKEMLKVQKRTFPQVYNGMAFYRMLQENCCAVTIETVALDSDDNVRKLEFGTKKGIWMNPDIGWYK